jgi:hypothetical protein
MATPHRSVHLRSTPEAISNAIEQGKYSLAERLTPRHHPPRSSVCVGEPVKKMAGQMVPTSRSPRCPPGGTMIEHMINSSWKLNARLAGDPILLVMSHVSCPVRERFSFSQTPLRALARPRSCQQAARSQQSTIIAVLEPFFEPLRKRSLRILTRHATNFKRRHRSFRQSFRG